MLFQSAIAEDNINFRFSSIGMLAGIISIEGDYYINENLSLTSMYIRYPSQSMSTVEHSLSAFGARVNWHFDEYTEDGFLVGIFYRRWSSESSNSLANGEANFNEISALVGYRWMWENFNVTAEAGVRNLTFDGAEFNSTYDAGFLPGEGESVTLPMADLSLGWFF